MNLEHGVQVHFETFFIVLQAVFKVEHFYQRIHPEAVLTI